MSSAVAAAAAAVAAAAAAVAEAAVVVEAVVAEVAAAEEVAAEEVAVAAEAESANRQVRLEADWARGTRSHYHRNPRPTSAPRVRTMRQRLLPVGCSPHINACPQKRFQNSHRRARSAGRPLECTFAVGCPIALFVDRPGKARQACRFIRASSGADLRAAQ
jgi:hypothetical protein